MRRTTAGCSIVATRWRRPPHVWQARTSIDQTRRSSSAHDGCGKRPGRARGTAEPGGAASLFGVPGEGPGTGGDTTPGGIAPRAGAAARGRPMAGGDVVAVVAAPAVEGAAAAPHLPRRHAGPIARSAPR